jgi:phosphopantetheinyl transferase
LKYFGSKDTEFYGLGLFNDIYTPQATLFNMPLQCSFDLPLNGRLYIWRITETEQQLRELLANSRSEAPGAIHPKRVLESLAASALLKEIGFTAQIIYLPNGKPVSDDSRYVSFSHCGELVGFAVSDYPVGMDIQDENEKLLKIAPRFCSQDELSWIVSCKNPLTCSTIIWSAKEAAFKVYGENLTFSRDIAVYSFNLDNEKPLKLECQIQGQWHLLQTSMHRESGYWIVTATLEGHNSGGRQ